MGVQGLLRNLKAVTVQRHIKEYKGQTIAIDTYAWLHRIIKGKCCFELYNFQISNRFINEILTRIDTFRQYGLHVIMVFDGAPLPGKVGQQMARKARRQQCEDQAMQLLNQGKNEQGNKKLIESVDITPQIAYRLIQTLKKKNIQFIVAPYQADAELAYLSRTGIADIILTQDSDLLAYGAKKVLYKYDINTCIGDQIQLQNIKKNQDPSLKYFNHCMFLSACIMSGCDYVSPIPGIGHKTAFRLISSNSNGGRAIEQAKRIKVVPSVYQENFVKAYLIFRFQYVYCPKQKKCVMVNNLSQQLEKKKNGFKPTSWIEQCLDDYVYQHLKSGKYNFEDFIGQLPDEQTAQGIGQAVLHPMTRQPYKQNTQSTTQVINLKRSKARVRKNVQNNSTIDAFFKPQQKFQVKVTQVVKKSTLNLVQLQPEQQNSKSSGEPVTRPKLLVQTSNTKKNFYKDLDRLLAPVFDAQWFQKFNINKNVIYHN